MNSEYYIALSTRILSVLKQRPLKFCEIIKESQGAYPDDVKISIDRLSANKQINTILDTYVVSNHHYTLAHYKNEVDVLPELSWVTDITNKLSKPHPADYDWRFTSKTIYDIVQLVNSNSTLYSSVALFGTTTLFPIIKKVLPSVNLSLFNKSPLLIEDLLKLGFSDALYVQDLFFEIPSINTYKLVIADPPWYNDFYNAFITRASEILEIGGHLFLSVLPMMTRPEAMKDRDYIYHCCKDNGLIKIDSFEGFLNYESPSFERNSLINRGIDCGNWRKGDLMIFKKNRNVDSETLISLPADEPSWEEFLFRGIKVKLLKNDDESDVFSFEYSDVTKTLGSVSRRSPIRTRINFWTSENLAFKISKIKVLRYLFRFAKTNNSMVIGLQRIKIDQKLTDDEFNSLIDLLTMANIYL